MNTAFIRAEPASDSLSQGHSFSPQEWMPQGKEQVHSWALLPETGDPHKISLAVSNTRVESHNRTNTFAFQAKLIPGAALLTMVEEHLKLIWSYRATKANLPHKPVRSEIHLTARSSTFVANFESQDLPQWIMNLWLPLSSTFPALQLPLYSSNVPSRLNFKLSPVQVVPE